MQKKLIALAVAGVMAAPLAAQAEATLYGKAHMSLDNYSGDLVDTGVNVSSRASRIGVKGSEDLGGGMSAVYGMEWQVAMDAGAGNNITTRNQFLGLAGGFGTVLMGTHDTPYKMSTGKLDLFSDTAADYNAIIGSPNGLENRGGNVLAYISPDFSGLKVAIAGVAAEDGVDTFAATSASITYSAGPLYVAVAMEDFEGAQNGTRAGLGYDFGAGKVGLVYETGEDAAADDFSAYLVNAAFGLGSGNTLIAEYGVEDPDTGVETTLMSVGIAHGFSKATSGYAAYGNLDKDTAGDESIVTFGLVHSF